MCNLNIWLIWCLLISTSVHFLNPHVQTWITATIADWSGYWIRKDLQCGVLLQLLLTNFQHPEWPETSQVAACWYWALHWPCLVEQLCTVSSKYLPFPACPYRSMHPYRHLLCLTSLLVIITATMENRAGCYSITAFPTNPILSVKPSVIWLQWISSILYAFKPSNWWLTRTELCTNLGWLHRCTHTTCILYSWLQPLSSGKDSSVNNDFAFPPFTARNILHFYDTLGVN